MIVTVSAILLKNMMATTKEANAIKPKYPNPLISSGFSSAICLEANFFPRSHLIIFQFSLN